MPQPEDDPKIKMLLLQAEAAAGSDYPNHKRGIVWGLIAAILGGLFGILLGFALTVFLKKAPSPYITAVTVTVLAGLFGYLFGAFRPSGT